MTGIADNHADPFSWSLSWIKTNPGKFIGILLNIIFRFLFGLFFLLAGFNKLLKGWLNSDLLEKVFLQRLTELNPDSFAYSYLTDFAIPLYPLIAWVVTLGELAVGIGLILGIATRLSSFGGFFILFNLAIGGYYDASLLPFFILNIIFIVYPSGHWLGFDAKLGSKFPKYGWMLSK
ncbi:MAG: DoxX family membrane protein [Alphaproteobacteria bacterium]|nr:DoxX family membrane protein [Alphaproteobacteria bacterium]